MIVVGIISLPLTYITMPIYIKFPILVIVSYIVSNLLVHTYRTVKMKWRVH